MSMLAIDYTTYGDHATDVAERIALVPRQRDCAIWRAQGKTEFFKSTTETSLEHFIYRKYGFIKHWMVKMVAARGGGDRMGSMLRRCTANPT